MRTIKTKSGIEVKIFSSAAELSIKRYNTFQKYLIIESSVEPLLVKLERSKAFIEEGKKDEGLIELKNSILCLNAVISGVGYYTYAFACLVAEIGNKPYSDITESGLDMVLDRLNEIEITYGEVVEVNETLKKKSLMN